MPVRSALVLALTLSASAAAQEGLYTSYMEAAAKASRDGEWPQVEKMVKLANKEANGFKSGDIRRISPNSLLARAFQSQGRYLEAIELFKQCLTILKAAGPEQYAVAGQASALGNLYLGVGRPDLAEPYYRQALKVKEAQPKRVNWEVAEAVRDLANLLAATGRFDEAEAAYKKSLSLLEGLTDRPPQVGITLVMLGKLYVATGKPAEAEALCRQGLVKLGDNANNSRSNHVFIARGRLVLGTALAAAGKPLEASAAYKDALTAYAAAGAYAAESPELPPVLTASAKQLRADGKAAEAAPLEARAAAITAKVEAARAKLPQ